MDELYGHYSFSTEKRDALEQWATHLKNVLMRDGGNVIVRRIA
jgi:hypothetical protein